MDVLKAVESVTSLAPIGPDEPLSLLGHHSWGTRQPQSQQAAEASVRFLIFPSWFNTYQAAQFCFKLEQRIRPSPPQETARERIWKTYTKLIQASDNLRMGGREKDLFIFMTIAIEKRNALLPLPRDLNWIPRAANQIKNLTRFILWGACLEPVCQHLDDALSLHKQSSHNHGSAWLDMQREILDTCTEKQLLPHLWQHKAESQGSLYYLTKTQTVEHKFQTRNHWYCCRWHSHNPGSWLRLYDWQ